MNFLVKNYTLLTFLSRGEYFNILFILKFDFMTIKAPQLPEGVTLHHALLPRTNPEQHGQFLAALRQFYGDRVKALLRQSSERITLLLANPSPDHVVVTDLPMLLDIKGNLGLDTFAGVSDAVRRKIDLLLGFLEQESPVPPDQGPFVISASGYAYNPYHIFLHHAAERGRVIGVHDFPFSDGGEFELDDDSMDQMVSQGHSFSYLQLASSILGDLAERSIPIDKRNVNRKPERLTADDDDDDD